MLRSLILGNYYISKKKFIEKTQFLPLEELAEIQLNSLRGVLMDVIANVAFYKKILTSEEVQGNISVLDIIAKFPIIDKQIIKGNLSNFLTGNSYRRLKATTGGSTGETFSFYMDRFKTRQVEKAYIFDQWGRVGYIFGDTIFNMRGRTPSGGRFVHHDRLLNIYSASSFDLRRETVGDYVSSINRIRPRFLHGYPSTMYQLACLMDVTGMSLNFQPAAVFCGSEKLFPYQRSKIEKVFDCLVYHWYGHSECLALGGACEYSDTLHFYPQYGYVELVPSGVTDEGGRDLFEIVATGFNNPIMPLIRYRTGDYAIPSTSKTCRCGRNYLLIDEVVGRQQEFVVDKNGSLISATSLIFGQHYAAFEGLESIKIHQQRLGEIDILLVKGSGFREDLCQVMQSRMQGLLGNRMSLRFIFVKETKKTMIGKAKLVEQDLDTREFLGR